eukprot:15472290-Alexandrium_andersonii.AAC.1
MTGGCINRSGRTRALRVECLLCSRGGGRHAPRWQRASDECTRAAALWRAPDMECTHGRRPRNSGLPVCQKVAAYARPPPVPKAPTAAGP